MGGLQLSSDFDNQNQIHLLSEASMKTRLISFALFLVAGCGGGGGGAVQLRSLDTSLGKAIADADGRLLYMFVDDMSGRSACIDDCANDWPPYLVTVAAADLKAEDGLTGTLSLYTRPDGKTQLVYGGYPLYYWAGDLEPGDLRGQSIGGDWFVLDQAGQPVTKDAPPPAWSGADSGKTLSVISTSVGMAVADSKGRPLYMFVDDTAQSSACTEDCANDWPPYTVEGTVSVATGLDQQKAMTITRGDGTKQVTYGGYPLYYWPADWHPGDLRGQAVGDDWFVVAPGGMPIK
jgi:predicted lipoprotein with Yx(FWY)xxD motif